MLLANSNHVIEYGKFNGGEACGGKICRSNPLKTKKLQMPQLEVAHPVFPDGNIYLRLRDEFWTIFEDEIFL
jgi:hypothetical protein